MLLFGKNVNGGILGANPVLGKIPNPVTLADVKDNLDMQFDYRRVYGTILRDWFGTSAADIGDVLTTPLYNGTQSSLGLIASSAVAGAGRGADVPDRYALWQNYPNPFNPATTIRYDLPLASVVRLEVYDAAGQRVAVLEEGERAAGIHTVRFDATHLASGAYFYRLQANGFSETKKALLVR